MNNKIFKNDRQPTGSSCANDQFCQALFNLIYAQANLFDNSNLSQFDPSNSEKFIDPVELSHKIYYCPFLFNMDYSLEGNSTFPAKELCRCITLSYRCQIETKIEENRIDSLIIKNLYLVLYIVLITVSFLINLLTCILLINEHKSGFKYFKRCFGCFQNKNKKAQNKTKNKNLLKNNKQSTQIASLNSISDCLLFCLLISYMIITVYVIPNQTWLFYNNTNLINCKLSEFFKAFSVSLSIYSLVAISLQRFFAIKFSQYSCSVIHSRLIDTLSFISIFSFFKSIGIIIHTFLFSRFYRRYLVTTILIILIWVISILIGFYNSSQYEESLLELKAYDFYEQNMSCMFPKDLKSSIKYCASKSSQNTVTFIEKSDIVYMICLLVVPNFIVLTCYTWVCYHIWSQGSRLNMSSFRLYYKHNKNLELQKCSIEKINKQCSTKLLNKISSENNSNQNQNEIEQVDKQERKTSETKSEKISNEILNKILKNSTTQSIQNYHQFSIKKRNMSVTLTTFLMVMCFSLCWAPFFIFPIFYSLINDANLYVNIKVIIHLIGYSSAIWNPIILIIKSKRFKLKVASLFKNIFCCFRNKKCEHAIVKEKTLNNQNSIVNNKRRLTSKNWTNNKENSSSSAKSLKI